MAHYFIVDDTLVYSEGEGFVVMFGDPETAVGVAQTEFDRLRDAKAYCERHTVPGEPVYRVRLARRHGAHSVRRIEVR